MDSAKQSFKDQSGNVWIVSVTVGATKRAKAVCGFEIDSLVRNHDQGKMTPHEIRKAGADSVQSLSDFVDDMERFSEVLYATCKPEADARGMTQDQFDELLTGETVELAQMAFLQALHDFFRQAPRKLIVRGVIEIRKKMATANAHGMKRAEKMIAEMKTENLEAMVDKEIDAALSNTATDLPGDAAA